MPMLSSATKILRVLSKFASAVLIAALIPSGIAHAGIVYNFISTSTGPAPFAGIPIYVEITPQAFSERQINSHEDFIQLYGNVPFVYSPADAVFETLSYFSIAIGDGPGSPLSGSFAAMGELNTLTMSESAGMWSGVYSTDAPFAPCNVTGTCRFMGYWEIVAVPEPASLAVLGTGCLAAVLFGRRRRGRM